MGSDHSKVNCSPVSITEEERRKAGYYNPISEQRHNEVESEGLLSADNVDRRRKLGKPLPDTLGNAVGQLLITMNGKNYVGTGTLINSADKNPNTVAVLTCAHNVTIYDPLDGVWHDMTGGFFYPACTKNESPKRYAFTSFVAHKDYKKKGSIYSGNDIAIIFIERMDETNHPVKDALWGPYAPIHANFKAKIYGYPGERDKSGDPYEMEGVNWRVHRDGKLIQVYDIDTTGGQSGSPFLVYDPNLEKWIVIGIHVGTNPASNENVATLISLETFKFIYALFD